MRWLRKLLLALAVALLIGFAIGTLIRARLGRAPRVFIGALPLAPAPGHVPPACARVLDPGHREEQIG